MENGLLSQIFASLSSEIMEPLMLERHRAKEPPVFLLSDVSAEVIPASAPKDQKVTVLSTTETREENVFDEVVPEDFVVLESGFSAERNTMTIELGNYGTAMKCDFKDLRGFDHTAAGIDIQDSVYFVLIHPEMVETTELIDGFLKDC